MAEICKNCDGEGKIDFSCCGDDIRGSDYEDVRICPSCHEHLGDPEQCSDCNGTGYDLSVNPKGCFIQGIELTDKNIGDKVTYIPRHARMDDISDANGRPYDPKGPTNEDYSRMNANHRDSEGGRIKSWNDGGVFVDYTRNVCRTDFPDLVWG